MEQAELPRAIYVARRSNGEREGVNYVQLNEKADCEGSNKPRKQLLSVKLKVGEVCS